MTTGSEVTGRLAVIGAGVMGVGIAALAAGYGLPVLLVEVDAARRDTAAARVATHLRLARLLGGMPGETAPATVTVAGDIAQLAGVTTVVESVTELPALKAEVLAAASAVVLPGTLLTTNTSAIPVAELAAAIKHPEWLVGTHFMNPPYLIRSVEVAPGPSTSDEAMAATRRLLAALGRQPVVVGDGPGFVSNRILMHMINDAARLVAEGRTGPREVDEVFTGCLGHRMGPLATADLIGLDNVVDTLVVLHERTGNEAYRPSELLLTAVREGRLGRKSGSGFHEYPGGTP
jgi:methoxymalonate biosynthesis protein